MTAAFARRLHRLVARVAAQALTVVLASGCAAAVNGSAQPDPNGAAVTATVSTTSTAATGQPGAPTSRPNPPVSTMSQPVPSSHPADSVGPSSAGPSSAGPSSAEPSDTAAYPTAPVPLPTHASTPSGGALLESARLGAYVVDPSAIEPRYVDPVNVVTAPIDLASKLARAFVAPVPAVAARDQVYAGFMAARDIGTGKPGSLIMVVLELPTAADAKKAVTDLSAADNSNHSKLSAFPGQPAAIGWVGPSGAGENAQAFLAVRSMVVYVYTLGAVSAKSTLPALVSATLATQVAALKNFTPTPKDKLGELPTDPAGIYARVLPVTGPRPLDNGYFTAKAMLHFMTGYASDGKVFADAGVDVVGKGRSTVYRARDGQGATAIRDAYYRAIQTMDPQMKPDPAGGVATVKCLQDTLKATYYCAGAVGRYAFEYLSTSEDDVNRSIASQVALLST